MADLKSVLILNMKALFVSAFVLLAITTRSQSTTSAKPIHQLRIYEIFNNNKQAFHERFRDHAVRIMKSYDFKIVAIWESQKADKTEFIYLLEWQDEKVMNESWAKFKADKEWIEIKKKTGNINGDLVGEIQEKVLILQDYSPSKTLLSVRK